MKTVNQIFDKVIYINSKNRPDRYRNMIERLRAKEIEAERMEAIYGGHVAPHEINFGDASKIKRRVNLSEVGCFLSHREIYKRIKANGWNNTLILEDDALFLEDFDQVMNKEYLDLPVDWDLLYFGTWNYDDGVDDSTRGKAPMKEQINERLYKADRCWLTHGYAVNIKAVDYLLKETNVIYSCFDNVLADIQHKLNVYAFYPWIIKQDGTISSLR